MRSGIEELAVTANVAMNMLKKAENHGKIALEYELDDTSNYIW